MNKKFAKPVNLGDAIQSALRPPPVTIVGEDGAVTQLGPAVAPAAEEGARQIQDMPWEQGNPRVISYFQLRLPEPLKIKLDWLYTSQKVEPGEKRQSAHQIAIAAFEREIDRLIAKALKERTS